MNELAELEELELSEGLDALDMPAPVQSSVFNLPAVPSAPLRVRAASYREVLTLIVI